MDGEAHRQPPAQEWEELASMLQEMEQRQQKEDATDEELLGETGSAVGPPPSSWRRKRQALHFAAPPLASPRVGSARPASIGGEPVEAKVVPRRPSRSVGVVSPNVVQHFFAKEDSRSCDPDGEGEDRDDKKKVKKERREKRERKNSLNKEEKEKMIKVRKDSKEKEREERKKKKEEKLREKEREKEEREREKKEKEKEREKENEAASWKKDSKEDKRKNEKRVTDKKRSDEGSNSATTTTTTTASLIVPFTGRGALTVAQKGSKSADDIASVVDVGATKGNSGIALRRSTSASATNPALASAMDREMTRSGTISRAEVRRKGLLAPREGNEKTIPAAAAEPVSKATPGPEQEDPLLVARFVIAFLIDAFVRYHGNEQKGVFRVPGDVDEVNRTKDRLKLGEFVLTTTDPFVVASVLLAWLAELPEPLIPFSHYDPCIEVAAKRGLAGGNEQAEGKEEFKMVARLPEANKSVIFDLLDFIKELAKPHNIAKTSMTLSSLAMVFQPVFLRGPDPTTLFLNSAYEVSFVKHLFLAYLTLSDRWREEQD